MSLPLRRRVPITNHVAIHEIVTRRDPGHLDELLEVHARAFITTDHDDYVRSWEVLRQYAVRNNVDLLSLRGCLTQIQLGWFSRTWPLVRMVERLDGTRVEWTP